MAFSQTIPFFKLVRFAADFAIEIVDLNSTTQQNNCRVKERTELERELNATDCFENFL